MSNQRESIIADLYTFLEGITKAAGYNNSPEVLRKREAWWDSRNFPNLHLEEGDEPETQEHLAFGSEIVWLNLVVRGRENGDWDKINSLVEDVRKMLDNKTENPYQPQLTIQSVAVYSDPDSELKEFELKFRLFYTFDVGGA